MPCESKNPAPDDASTELLAQVGAQQLMDMFSLLTDVLFWVKTRSGRIAFANHAFLAHFGLTSLAQAQRSTDYDFAPRHLARQYLADDARVMQGQDVTERLELNQSATGQLGWFSTTKRCLRNSQGEVLGSYGVARHLDKTALALDALQALKTPVDYIRQHFREDICLRELAGRSHLSLSALERRFKKYLRQTPKQFIHQIRLEHARSLLEHTQLPIATVAAEVGFHDHSYFSRLFKRHFDALPSEFRQPR